METHTLLRAALAAGVLFTSPILASSAFAGAGHGKDGHEHMAYGEPGDPEKVSRTLKVVMHDNYFEPETIDVSGGETVRIVVENAGELVHEFNIGTAAMHAAHQDEMMMMLDHGVLEADQINWQAAKDMQATMGHGMHEDPNALLLEPGQSGEVVWTFPENLADISLEFGCNVPGHYDAGMVGNFRDGDGS